MAYTVFIDLERSDVEERKLFPSASFLNVV